MIDHRDAFWSFVTERDRIWTRREVENLPEPWTDDPVLRDYHFTNVHRWKDPGTRWIVEQTRKRRPQVVMYLVTQIYAYRGLNRRRTFEVHGLPPPNPALLRYWIQELDGARANGETLGSGRHLTYWTRVRDALPRTYDRELARRLMSAETGVEATKIMQSYKLYTGPFLGTQIVSDLVTINPFGIKLRPETAAMVGGGSRYGLQLVEGTMLQSDWERGAFDERTAHGRRNRDLVDGAQAETDRESLNALVREQPHLSAPLNQIDIEHSLCEYARYARLVSGDLTRAAHMRRRREEAQS